ncbi:MAG TPA: hypothetical protein VKE22_14610 [Haliangiales bacterium]|nr:hypothetical protein [Haliangiales bacterium]
MESSLHAGSLLIEVEDRGEAGLRVVWQGKSSDRQPERVLEPFFARLVEDCATRRVGMEMRFERLHHFNSSTIGYLIQLIKEMRGRGIRLVIYFDHALLWQKLSFEALRVFSKDELLQIRGA